MSTIALLLLVGQLQPDPLDRLIAEAKGPSNVRRELAARALAAYGGAAARKIAEAKVDRALFVDHEFYAPDHRLQYKLRYMKIDLAFEESKLSDILQFVTDFTGAETILDPHVLQNVGPDKQISLKVRDLSVHDTLRRLGSRFGLSVFYRNGGVFLSDAAPTGPARLPLRIGAADATVEVLIKALASDSIEERTEAAEALSRLNFAAEAPLWKALDSEDPDVRAHAVRLIRRLYSPGAVSNPTMAANNNAMRKRLGATTVTLDFKKAPVFAILDYLRKEAELLIATASVNGWPA